MEPSSLSDPRILDKNYRINNLYKITDKNGAVVNFQPNRAQQHFHTNRTNKSIILKSRRLGFTTDSAIDMLDDTMFNKFFFSLFISYDEASSKKVFSNTIKFAWDNHPLKKFYEVDNSSANALKILLGENVYSLIEVKTSGRGDRTSYLHISEFGKICARFPDKATEIISGSFPSLVPDGRLTIESTAEGETGAFHDMFWDAWDNPNPSDPNSYKAFFYNWQWDDWEITRIKEPIKNFPQPFLDYQQKHNELSRSLPHLYQPITDIQLTYWYQKFLSLNKRWDLLLENYPTTPAEAFVASGKKMFDQHIIQTMLDHAKEPIRIVNKWHIYKERNASHNYVMGADVAEGVGGDHSAAVILDLSTTLPTLVATYKSNEIAPDLFAYELKSAGEMFNTAFVAPERNAQGYATITKLKDIYPLEKIYKEEKDDYEEERISERFGYSTNKMTKPKMLYDLASVIAEQTIHIEAREVLKEMRVIDKSDTSIRTNSEETSKHYDLLMALAIAIQAIPQARTHTQGITTISFLSETSDTIHNGV